MASRRQIETVRQTEFAGHHIQYQTFVLYDQMLSFPGSSGGEISSVTVYPLNSSDHWKRPDRVSVMGQLSDEWWALNRSAEGYFSRGGYQHAMELWREALPLAEQLGESDERYKKTITGVCRAMIMMKQDWEVIPWLFRSLELAELYEEGGIYNENCARITFRLAKTYRAYSMPTEAEEQFKKSLAIHTKVYGAADSFTVEVLSEYAELLNELHREDEAQHMMYCALGYLGGEWKPIPKPTYDVDQG